MMQFFENVATNFSFIADKVANHAREFSNAKKLLLCWKLILNNFYDFIGSFLFSFSKWYADN